MTIRNMIKIYPIKLGCSCIPRGRFMDRRARAREINGTVMDGGAGHHGTYVVHLTEFVGKFESSDFGLH